MPGACARSREQEDSFPVGFVAGRKKASQELPRAWGLEAESDLEERLSLKDPSKYGRIWKCVCCFRRGELAVTATLGCAGSKWEMAASSLMSFWC